MQTVTTIQQDTEHPASQLISFADLQKVAKERFHGYEHWIVVFDNDSKQFVDRVARRFYKNADAEDFSIFATLWRGRLFGTAVLRKRFMLINSLRRELSRYSINLSKKQMEARDLLIVTAPKNLWHGTDLAEAILGNPDGPKGPAPPPIDGRWPPGWQALN